MKKFVFISMLFFIFALQVQAQTRLHAGPTGGGLYSRDYSSYSRNSSGKSYESSSSKRYGTSSGKSNGGYLVGNYTSNYILSHYSNEDYEKGIRYIDAMYKTYGEKPTEAKPVDKRAEFSENK